MKTALTENGVKRRRERVAGSEKKATAIPQSSMNLCDPSTVDRTPDEKRRKVRSRDGKRRDVKSVKKRRPQATSGRQIGEETAASSTPTLRKQECAPPWVGGDAIQTKHVTGYCSRLLGTKPKTQKIPLNQTWL